MTKSQINKVGRNIRKNLQADEEISEVDLLALQEYRTSFQSDLASVFNIISSTSKKERSDSIVSFRIKRIESILSKIRRQPTMALGNMGDIAGCRVIVYSQEALLSLIEKFHVLFNVKDVNDYLEENKDDGYRGYHLYIESPINENRLIEIQLRTVLAHKWASLVEIIDILYNAKIKEGEKHPDLQKFLLFMSQKDSLTIEDKHDIIAIDKKYSIYKKLNEVFVQNHIKVRRDWIDISNSPNNYFIIEVDEKKKSNLHSFESYRNAEDKYFEMFGDRTKSNFVLTHIEKPNFKRVCIAYASYMLVNHDYLEDWSQFTMDIILDVSVPKPQSNVDYYAEYINRNLKDQMELVKAEIAEVNKYHDDQVFNEGLTEWLEDLRKKMRDFDEISGRHNELSKPKNRGFFRRLFG